MPVPMLQLGDYQFSLQTAAPQSLSHAAEYRWAELERAGRLPASQYTGPGPETIELEGTLYPEFAGGLGQLDRMRAEAGRGEPLHLVDYGGNVRGRWVILRVEEGRKVLFPDGTPRRVDFRLSLRRYGEDA